MAVAVPVHDVASPGGTWAPAPDRDGELDLFAAEIAHGADDLVWFVRLTLLGLVGLGAVLFLLLG